MEFDLVIFDCDGVLVDSEMLSVRADIECLAEHAVDISAEEILERYTGISMAGMLADLEARCGRTLPGFAERHRQCLERLFEEDLRPIPGVVEVLDSLTCPSCVASSSDHQRIRHALSLVGLLDRFQPNLFSAVDVKHGKPAPDLFLHAAALMGVAPVSCVVIEDSLPGVAAAVAAGMTAIGFIAGSHCRPGHDSRLLAQGAALVVGSMAELLPALGRPAL